MNLASSRFSIRGANLCESLLRHSPAQVEAFLDRMVENRLNTLIIHVAYGYNTFREQLEHGCQSREIDIVYYLQTSLLFLKGIAPKYFAKDREGRIRTAELRNETRLCVSNHEARAAFRDAIQYYFSAFDDGLHKKLLFIDADGYLFCQCPGCEKLGAVEQWMVLYRIILEEGEQSGKDVAFWYLSYVWRYQLPKEIEIFDRVEAVLFDTHQRCRWAAIGEEHALSVFNELEAQADPRAASIPLNSYLAERLVEWREAIKGKLVIFENLMLQGSISCPQPYTPQILRDLDFYESCKVDGFILEAFEPGIGSFTDQLARLSRALVAKPTVLPPPSALEHACYQLLRNEVPERFNYKNQFNVLSYLTTSQFDGLELLKAESDDPLLIDYLSLLRPFLLERSASTCAQVLEYVLAHPDRFDWIMIAFNLLRAVEPPLQGETRMEASFLESDKLWDWMEALPDPITTARGLIGTMAARLQHPASHEEDAHVSYFRAH